MQLSLLALVLVTVAEILLLGLLVIFFFRLRRSENVLSQLQANHEKLLARLHFNAELEQELVESFAQRQEELRQLDIRLEQRAADLRRLMEQAEGISRSPQFLREIIMNGRRKGRTVDQLARSTGLSADEVELILGNGSAG
ncbi:hypothetical protein Dde_0387 [Oleidesulfovibrio alaskensis G20]|jgi:uncharacterized protein HemX|uniref:DUF2802 domain-containing protein n=1 Tax=Oleidesulfovibrio alaskensis (strain ATCC BAA-1058 / DSM 17464 / G20) TaxID=207559 RepID=Q316F8_OLEA2|nr:hypothetical protein [Oleidesulfovibrio alaskensis]ABB37188.1 hypothetical protein Dde_0387 [Oleidesulfovibrio alaskensis G20]MBG0772623.1 hypothetical protein [Oleidesulfovibrio alaskensis]